MDELCVDEATTAECPVLPSCFLEAHHYVLRIQPLAGERSHEFLEQLLLDLDAATDGPKD
jgi:hypothetical protein